METADLEVDSIRLEVRENKPIPEKSSVKGKIDKIKEKSYQFFSTISIPGISRIFTTKNYVFKLLWTVLVLISVSYGFINIARASQDFNKFDVITNIERVNPIAVTFPAITVCAPSVYKKMRFKNGSIISSEDLCGNSLSIQNFAQASFDSDSWIYETVNDIEYFHLPDQGADCLRFNGALNKLTELYKVNGSNNGLRILINHSYNEYIADGEYYQYIVNQDQEIYFFSVFIVDNTLNSFDKIFRYTLSPYKGYTFKIEIPYIEKKLDRPHNHCQESKNGDYHQMNCIETCIYREIKNSFNCTFDSLFAISGLEECTDPLKPYDALEYLTKYKNEFYAGCEKECPPGCYTVHVYADYVEETYMSYVDYGFTAFDFTVSEFSSLNITQIPKISEFNFLSEIGGSLGLFMGLSILHFIEVVEFIIDLFTLAFIH